MEELLKQRKIWKSKATKELIKMCENAEKYGEAMKELRNIQKQIDAIKEKAADEAVREALGINGE